MLLSAVYDDRISCRQFYERCEQREDIVLSCDHPPLGADHPDYDRDERDMGTHEYSSVGLKCQPDRIEELKLQYDCIGTASHMSPKHWIGVKPDCGQDDLLRELTRNSYEIVKAKYKAKKQ